MLAFLMFWIYRQDRKSSEERFAEIIKQMELRQVESTRIYNETSEKHTEAVIKNTQVQAELFIYLKARNGGRAQANG